MYGLLQKASGSFMKNTIDAQKTAICIIRASFIVKTRFPAAFNKCENQSLHCALGNT